MITFLLDQGGPRSAVDHLRAAGHDAVHTSSIGLASADDEVILQRARRENRVVVTLDADFHALLATSAARKPSTIRIRQEGLHGEDVARIVAHVVAAGATELQAGVVVTVREGRIRWASCPFEAHSSVVDPLSGIRISLSPRRDGRPVRAARCGFAARVRSEGGRRANAQTDTQKCLRADAGEAYRATLDAAYRHVRGANARRACQAVAA